MKQESWSVLTLIYKNWTEAAQISKTSLGNLMAKMCPSHLIDHEHPLPVNTNEWFEDKDNWENKDLVSCMLIAALDSFIQEFSN